RSVAFNSCKAAASRTRFSRPRAQATSTSYEGYEEPRAIPAIPPISTKSTSCAISACSIGLGRNSAGTRGAAITEDVVRDLSAVIDALGDCAPEVLLQQRHVVPVVDRTRVEDELLAHQVEERAQRLDGGRDEATLDPRDRGLRGARPRCELRLREPMTPTGFAEELSGSHEASISDLMYEPVSQAQTWESARPLEGGRSR